jgi:predicted nucleic acid-binding protein
MAASTGGILVDTAAFIALADAGDHFHADARAFVEHAGRPRWVTTVGVVGETYTWLRYNAHHKGAIAWLETLDRAVRRGTARIIYPDPGTDARARKLLAKFSDQALSYVDAINLVAASDEIVDAIFSFDHHMGLTGIPLVPGKR